MTVKIPRKSVLKRLQVKAGSEFEGFLKALCKPDGECGPYLGCYEIVGVTKRGVGAKNPKYGATARVGCVSTLTERLQETLKSFALSKISGLS